MGVSGYTTFSLFGAMSMVHDRIARKISRIEGYLSYIEDMRDQCNEKIHVDHIYRGAMLHYLYLVADSAVSLAEMVLRYYNHPTSQSYHEAIDALGEHGIIPSDFAYSFAPIASFRNFLAHDYEKVDYTRICNEMLSKMDEVRQYIEYIRKTVT